MGDIATCLNVEVVDNLKDVRKFADKWIGQSLVTFQTDEKGQPVNEILIETCTDIDKELYTNNKTGFENNGCDPYR